MDVEGLVRAEDLADTFAEQASRGTTAERAAADRTWTYGHIVVDEAQELSPMQWRLLRRRGPLRSFTIVGDIAQASAAASANSWREAVAPLVGRSRQGDGWRLEELTVNYRTPSQIAEAAQQFAEEQGLPVTRSTSVRESEWPITTVRASAAPGELPGEVGLGAVGLTRSVAVMTPQEAKGLEFDSVVIVDRERIVAEIPRGASALYVSMTRPTQRLTFVEPAPDALSA